MLGCTLKRESTGRIFKTAYERAREGVSIMYTCREGEEEEEEEDLLIFNDTIDGPRVPAAKPGGARGRGFLSSCPPAPPPPASL